MSSYLARHTDSSIGQSYSESELVKCATQECCDPVQYYITGAKLYSCEHCATYIYIRDKLERLVKPRVVEFRLRATSEAITNAEEYFFIYCTEATWPAFAEMLREFKRKYSVLEDAFHTAMASKSLGTLLDVLKGVHELRVEIQDHPEYKTYLEHKENTELSLKAKGEFDARRIREQLSCLNHTS